MFGIQSKYSYFENFTQSRFSMDLQIKNTAAEAAKSLAEFLAQKIRNNSQIAIGFPTGRTMEAVYFHLSEISRKDQLDCSKVKAFLLDEYIGVSKGSKNLFQEYLKLHLFEQFNFSDQNLYVPDVFSEDYDQSARDFEKSIRDVGGLDLVILGIGTNGHIAFNEPGSAADSRTRVVALTSSTLKSNQLAFKNATPPKTAMTMGIGTILEAKEVIMLATGESKAEVIVRFINGDVNSQLPASALKAHNNFHLILDTEASKLI